MEIIISRDIKIFAFAKLGNVFFAHGVVYVRHVQICELLVSQRNHVCIDSENFHDDFKLHDIIRLRASHEKEILDKIN